MYWLTNIGLIFFMYPADIICSLEEGHWVAVLFGFLLHVLIIVAYTKGLNRFPGQNLIEIFMKMSRVFGIALLIPVFIYLIMVTIITLRAYSEMITIIFLSNTPLWAIMVLLLFISSYMASLGVEALFRTALILAALFIPLIVFVLLTSFQNADWRYIHPIFDREAVTLSFITSRSFLKSLFAFAGGFLFLGFVPPQIAYSSKKVVWASGVLLPLYLISVYAPLMTFGQSTSSHFQFPFITTVDAIELDWLMFDRITMIFMLVTITFVMLFMALVIWKMVCLLQIGFTSVKPLYLIAALALFIFIICLQIAEWREVERMLWWNTLLRLYVMTVVPTVIFLLGIRRKGRMRSSNV
jgi:hypothetical protein